MVVLQVEHRPSKPRVAGSSPAGRAKNDRVPIDGVAIGPKSFGENLPLRGQMPIAVEIDGPTSTTRVIQSPVFNAVAGAMAIQAGIDQFERLATGVPPC